jgi:uncharacterized 2Fe-2S/4Fe-4S cluster protein (DUF4445 family)
MPNVPEFTINFQPIGKRINVEPKVSLMGAAQAGGIALASLCGGIGVCDSCKVLLIKGQLSEPTLEELAHFSAEELTSGFRLACQAFPLSDVTIDIPPESLTAPQRLQIEGQSQIIQLEPAVLPIEVSIPEPMINDLRSDTARVRDEIEKTGVTFPVKFEYPVLENISTILRSQRWQASLAMRKETIVAIYPPSTPLLGLAVDLGTTKLAAYLCDLGSGQILAKSGAMNPQTAFGEDVISRISYTNTVDNGRKILHDRLVDTLNQLTGELCAHASKNNSVIKCEQIVDAVVVGNTAMHHLFAGLPVRQLGSAPYVPAASEPLDILAREVGLDISPGAHVHMPPNIAGYVGADHVAMLLSTGIWSTKKTAIALDIGTNTEISLMHEGKLLSCSCASGPAFEGAHIQAGMRAAPGAIERVQVIKDGLRIQTIDNLEPVGICGSGILDAIACMLDIEALDHRGALSSSHPSVRSKDKQREFVLVNRSSVGNNQDIVITRQDVNEIQLAKGAIRAGIEILLAVAGIAANQIESFIIAGAFGTYINVPSAIRIGMFPKLPLDHYHQVGNAAGAGARQMLLSLKQRCLAEEIAKRVTYIELSSYPGFTNEFSKALFF